MLNATQTSPSRTATAAPESRERGGDERPPSRGPLPHEPELEPEPHGGAEPEPIPPVGEFAPTAEPEWAREPEPKLESEPRLEPEANPAPEPEVEADAGRNGDDPEPAATDPEVPTDPGFSVEQQMEIRFQRLKQNAVLPERANEGDAGMDLRAAEGARIGPGQRVGVGTGLAIEIPEGWAGLVLPRSGLALKNGIALVNSPGLIDPGYRGEIRVLLLNTDATAEFKVAEGDRIAQLVLTPFSTAQPVEAKGLGASARGEGGFGSSGA